ncbi:MAG TPA: hypothetical protein VIJ07_10315 [Dermatophilaceae bacterium]
MSENPFHAHDSAARDKAIRDSIRAKGLTRPQVDSNGTRLDHVLYRYDENGALVGAVKDTLPASRPGAPRYDSHGRVVTEHTED